MKKSWMTFTQAEADRWRDRFSTSQGVVFHEEHVPDGVRLTLLNEGQSQRILDAAAGELLFKRDVVGAIELAEVTDVS